MQQRQAERLVVDLQHRARTGDWMIVIPLTFSEPLESPYGLAESIISILGFYPSQETAVQIAEDLAIKYPGQQFSVERSNVWAPICKSYKKVNILQLDQKGNASKFTKQATRNLHQQYLEQQEQKTVEDSNYKDSLEYYAQERYLRYKHRRLLQQAELNIQEFEQSHPDRTKQLKGYLETLLQETNEPELIDAILHDK